MCVGGCSATFKDQLVELVSGAAPAVGEGARARLVNAAHTIVGALIDSHIWASPVNLYNNASVRCCISHTQQLRVRGWRKTKLRADLRLIE